MKKVEFKVKTICQKEIKDINRQNRTKDMNK